MEIVWNIALIVIAIMFLTFTFVIAFGAPFLPTLSPQVNNALDLIDLKPGQTLLELGSGDGRVLVAAAERGLNVIGYELNPILALYSHLKTYKYRGQVKVVWGNFWKRKWPLTDGIFVFLMQPYMEKLDTKIVHQYTGKHVKLVSFAFDIKSKKPAKTHHGLFLYEYK
jgi:16S rRNA A1518/A1519 N6-dimethyltransferase RsmA/KsgA/DIM1 with predicted DNA glycosylase/AP lyase activity